MLRSLIAGLTQRKPPQLLQQELDTYKLAILTTLRLYGPDSEQAEALRQDGAQSRKRTDQHAEALRANLGVQLAGLLDISAPPQDVSDCESWQREAGDRLVEAVGFTLEVRPSSAPDGGLGVFVRGEAAPGTTVALWPGLVYPPDSLQRLPGFPNPQLTNDHLVARYDGTVIDAQPVCFSMHESGGGLEHLGWNPLAVAHRVNHPPPETPPNLLNTAIEYSPALRASAPNLPFDYLSAHKKQQQKQKQQSAGAQSRRQAEQLQPPPLCGLAMVSIAPLRDGDELFVAYRFNPKHPTPVRTHARTQPHCRRRLLAWQHIACTYEHCVVVCGCLTVDCLSASELVPRC
jgi:hypothetical protein